eukprot:6186975-Pleurochrysis_carterae.AAC.1
MSSSAGMRIRISCQHERQQPSTANTAELFRLFCDVLFSAVVTFASSAHLVICKYALTTKRSLSRYLARLRRDCGYVPSATAVTYLARVSCAFAALRRLAPCAAAAGAKARAGERLGRCGPHASCFTRSATFGFRHNLRT